MVPLVVIMLAVGAWRCQTASISHLSSVSTTPVPILRQVNSVQDDGSYTYGFEAADGTFKLETRSADGKVVGKYGYVDANGERQVFEYNADKSAGFSASGDLVPQPSPEVLEVAAKASANRQLHAGQVVDGINIALDGFSEDRDQDGFVDSIPGQQSGQSNIQPISTIFAVADDVRSVTSPSAVQLHVSPATSAGNAAFTSQFVAGHPSSTLQTQQRTSLNDNKLANELHKLFLQQHQLDLLQQLQRSSQNLPGNPNFQPRFLGRSQHF